MTLLTLDDLDVDAADGVPLLRGVSLELGAGERVALAGPSGVGKTSLLRAVCGLDTPARGEVRLEGRTGEEWGWPAFRRRVLLVEQRPLVFDAGVIENLRRPFAYRNAPGPFPEARAAELLDRLGLGAARGAQNARSLSVGQQQRLCLVRALLLEPPVLLLDEPTSALDPDAARAVEGLIAEEGDRRGLACLIVTHDPEQVRRWCHRGIDLTAFRPAGTVAGVGAA